MRILLIISFLMTCLTACNNQEDKKKNTSTSIDGKDSAMIADMQELPEGLSVKYLGIYTGKQDAYFMRNANGEEIVVRGEKVSVPACDYKFIIKLNKLVTLQQINLSNNQRIVYEGTYQIVDDNDNHITISCAVSDGSGSSPNYTLQIDKASKSAVCFSDSEPEFTLEYGSEKKGTYYSSSPQVNTDSSVPQLSNDPLQDSTTNF